MTILITRATTIMLVCITERAKFVYILSNNTKVKVWCFSKISIKNVDSKVVWARKQFHICEKFSKSFNISFHKMFLIMEIKYVNSKQLL